MEYIRIRNWDKFQHYKKRNPPWIKVDTGTLDNYEYGRLPDSLKGVLFALLLLAAKTNNKIPNDPEWIRGRLSLQDAPDLEPLFSMRFIEMHDASNLLAPCKQNAMPEERRDRGRAEESRAEQSIQTEAQKRLREEAMRLARRMS